jgi:shikimate dehydrogenase
MDKCFAMVSGAAKVAGIYGDPVAHSLSPAMHNAAYAALGCDRIYVPFRVADSDLPEAIRAVQALNFLGVNLTVPHKEHGTKLLRNRLSREAISLGAVNCVVNRGSELRGGELRGDNTDARGLELALRELGAASLSLSVIVIGAGGGAAAAVLACYRLGARRIIIANRTRTRAQRLAKRFPKVRVEVRDLKALRDRELIAGAGLIINATSIGIDSKVFPELAYDAASVECLFYDLIYSREPTAFLKPAAALGFRTADGASMLLHQGALAFQLFNRIEPPVDVMRRALMEKLGRA